MDVFLMNVGFGYDGQELQPHEAPEAWPVTAWRDWRKAEMEGSDETLPDRGGTRNRDGWIRPRQVARVKCLYK